MHQVARDLDKLISKELPEETESKLGEMVSNSFRNERYSGNQKSKKWQHRKGQKKVRKRDRKNILVDEGILAGSFETFSRKGESGISTPVPYAPVHNEGLKAGKGKGFKMPQRQIMPKPGEQSPVLTKHVFKFLDKKGDEIFNKR